MKFQSLITLGAVHTHTGGALLKINRKLLKLLFISLFILIFSQSYVNAATTYYDWSAVETLDPDYSYSTLFFTDKTEFKVLENTGTLSWKTLNSWKTPYIYLVNGQKATLLITKCAINKNGDLCDVVIKLDNVKCSNTTDSHCEFELQPLWLLKSQKSATNPYDIEIQPSVGDLITFNLEAKMATCDLTMTYYIADTYNYNNDSGTLADITCVNNLVYDLDVPSNNTVDKTFFLQGDEGLIPTNGVSSIYYNKNNPNNVRLVERNNGIACTYCQLLNERNTNAIYYESSALIITNNINSTYKFTYGGKGCGILWNFVSPYPYEIEKPTKSVSKASITELDKFNYTISQYIPNNYYGSLVNFSEIYTNLYSDTHYKSLVISDTLNSNLVIDGTITIKNESGKDVTSYFDIKISGNTVTATAKSSALNSLEFYSHTYKVNIPVYVKKGTGSKLTTTSSITNAASTSSVLGIDTTKLNTNTVSTTLYYNINTSITNGTITNSSIAMIHTDKDVVFSPNEGYKVTSVKVDGTSLDVSAYVNGGTISFKDITSNHSVEVVCEAITPIITIKTSITNGSITPDSIKTVSYGANNTTIILIKPSYGYKLDTVSFDGNGYNFSDFVKNEDGTYTLTINDKNVKQDIEHIIIAKCNLKDTSVISKYVDESGKEITNTETIEGKVFDEYETKEKEIYGYELTKTPENSKGQMAEEQIIVTYVYKLKDTSVIVKYVDEEGKEISDTGTIPGKVFDPYTTEEKTIYGYELIEKPENSEGEMTEEQIVVTYVYKLKDTSVISKYVDESGKELANTETIEGKVFDEYETKEKTIYGYELIEKPENSKGQMTEEQIVVTYSYKLKDTTVISKYVDEEGKELVGTETIPGKVFDKYETTLKEIPGYEITEKEPENYKGEMTEEPIEVTYCYKKLPFDIKIQKYIEKIIQGETTTQINESDSNQLVKIDIDGKKVQSENIKIFYTLKIKNEGKVDGMVGKVTDYIPEGLEFIVEDNETYWIKTNGAIETEYLKDYILKPGEEVTLKVVLRWKNDESNTGIKENIVKLSNLTNEFNFEDINPENNESNAKIIITVKTGFEGIANVAIIIVALTGLLLITLKIRKKVKNNI